MKHFLLVSALAAGFAGCSGSCGDGRPSGREPPAPGPSAGPAPQVREISQMSSKVVPPEPSVDAPAARPAPGSQPAREGR